MAKQSRLTWPMLVDKMREPVRTKETYNEYLKLPKDQQDAVKDVGWFVGGRLRDGVRKKDHLESRDLLTLDIDFATKGWEVDLDLAFGDSVYAVYSTHKHAGDRVRLRLVLPLLRSVTPEEYPAVARMVASWWDVEVFDDTTYQASRVMYWPSCSADADFVFLESESVDVLDPDKVLAEYEDWRDIGSWPVSMRQGRAIETRVENAADPLLKRGPIGDWCRAYSIPEAIAQYLPTVYVQGVNPDRYTFTGGSTSNGAIVYNDGRFLYSNHGTDPCGGRSVNAFDLIRVHLYKNLDARAREDVTGTKLPSYKAMIDLVNRDDVVAKARVDAIFDDFDGEEAAVASVEVIEKVFELNTGDVVVTEEDRQALKNFDRDVDGNVKNHISNAILILKHDPRLKGAVAINEFMNDIVQARDLPGRPVNDTVNGDFWDDSLDSWVVAYIHGRYGIELPGVRMMHAINNVAGLNRFHPVRHYLEGLKWDGVERLSTLFIDYLKADDTSYTRAVTRKTLVAAVSRIMTPGIKFDTFLILEGLQGIGKSSFLASLAKGWFTDNVGSMGKDSVENMKGKWIGEIGELAHFKKADVEHSKAFMSRSTDRVREAYARRSKDYPRQFIVIGTTNDDDYLKDTENRRSWPVACHETAFVSIRSSVVDQIWAEALRAFDIGESIHLEDVGVMLEAQVQQAARRSDNDAVADLGVWLANGVDDDFDDDGTPRDTVSTAEVWSGFFQGRGRPNNAEQAQIRRLMKMVDGWSNTTQSRKVRGVSSRVYLRTGIK